MEDAGGMDDGERDDGGRVEAWALVVVFYFLAGLCAFATAGYYIEGKPEWIRSFPLMIFDILFATYNLRKIRG